MATRADGPVRHADRSGHGASAGFLPLQPLSNSDSAVPMKRWILPALIIAIGVAAIVHAERQHVGTQASPAAMLQMTGEAEQSLSRVPVSVTHVSDADEARLGDEL